MEDYFFNFSEEDQQDQLFVLIIYDIVDNKQRVKFAKLLQSYGFRIQKSAFEAVLSKSKLKKLTEQIPKYINKEDNVRLYRIQGKGQVTTWGTQEEYTIDNVFVW